MTKILIEIDTDTQRVVPITLRKEVVREVNNEHGYPSTPIAVWWKWIMEIIAAAPQPDPVDVDLLKEVHLINDNYKRIRSERQFAIDDIEYDLFSAGWKAAIDLAMSQGEQK